MNSTEIQQAPTHPVFIAVEQRMEIIQQACSNNIQFANLFTSLQKASASNPKILQCSKASVLDALMAAAKLGIDPSGEHNSAWFIPFKGKLTLMLGYNGYIDLITRSSTWHSVHAEVVYEGESFEVLGGTANEIRHTPDLAIRNDLQGRKIIGAYAIANGPGGACQFAVLDKPAIMRAYQASKNKMLWDGSTRPEMVKKTAVRALAKMMVLDRIGKFATAISDDGDGYEMRAAPATAQDVQSQIVEMLEIDPDTNEHVPPASELGQPMDLEGGQL